MTNEALDSIIDKWLETGLPESCFDETSSPLLEDKKVLKVYESTIKNIGERFSISLLFKRINAKLPNNYSMALN